MLTDIAVRSTMEGEENFYDTNILVLLLLQNQNRRVDS